MGLVAAVVIVVLTVVIVSSYLYAQGSPYKVSAEEARRLLATKQVDVVLDVRTDIERQTIGAYPGSAHIQAAELAIRMPVEFPDRSVMILVYCNTGQRARAAVEKLRAMGYDNTVYITGSHLSLL